MMRGHCAWPAVWRRICRMARLPSPASCFTNTLGDPAQPARESPFLAMLLNKLYYSVKPYLPWRVRLAMRRWQAQSRKKRWKDVWPIDEKAGITPPNWPGWPGGRRFAVVLTHDVEGVKGLHRVEQLMDIELKHGFRSSFNFVPNGDYLVPDSLRRKLEQGGFEVGVHGFEHDGRLYRSKAEFAAKAVLIRDCLRRWNASGFRSPFMQHKLSWLHELEAGYDASHAFCDRSVRTAARRRWDHFSLLGAEPRPRRLRRTSLYPRPGLHSVRRSSRTEHPYLEGKARLDISTWRDGVAKQPPGLHVFRR